MDTSAFESLLTATGQEALETAIGMNPVEADFLGDFQALCKSYPRELARSALETAILRDQAFTKFGNDARLLYFTREALEQATHREVAIYRAARFEPFESVADLGCSIGGDTLALAGRAAEQNSGLTIGLELDRLRVRMARANARALGLDDRVFVARADLTAGLPLTAGPGTALFFDPARRGNGRRVYSVKDYTPPLSVVHGWLGRFPSSCWGAVHLYRRVSYSPSLRGSSRASDRRRLGAPGR